MLDQTEFTNAIAANLPGGEIEGLDKHPTPVAELLPQIYEGLKQIAEQQLRFERRDHTLQPTALVHEAYLRLADQTRVPWADAVQFRAITARVMRQVLIDHARKTNAAKRGGPDRARITLSAVDPTASSSELDVLELDEAMQRLHAHDERKARVVELLYFGGMTHAEAALVIGVSRKTVESDWYMARAWLGRELGHNG